MTRACEDDWDWNEIAAVGHAGSLNEFDDWSEEDITAYEERLARKRPMGFGAVWPEDEAPADL